MLTKLIEINIDYKSEILETRLRSEENFQFNDGLFKENTFEGYGRGLETTGLFNYREMAVTILGKQWEENKTLNFNLEDPCLSFSCAILLFIRC